jgi:hypothetical protein
MRYRLLGELLFGGGLAIAHFVTYALHFVPVVAVIESEGSALFLLAASVAAIVGAAQRLRSETVAGIAMFLGLHASLLAPTTTLSLAAVSLLAIGALYFVLKNRWVVVPVSCLVAVYSTHAWWAVQEPARADGVPSRELAVGLGFLTITFALFQAAVLVRPQALSSRAAVAWTLLNAVGFVAIGSWDLRGAETAWLAAFLAMAATWMASAAWIAARKNARALLETLLCSALLTSSGVVCVCFSRAALVIGLAVLGAAGLWLRRGASWVRAVGLGLLTAGAAAAVFDRGIHPLVPALLATTFIAGMRLPRPIATASPPTSGEPQLRAAFDTVASVGAVCTLVRSVVAILPDSLTTLAWSTGAVMTVAIGFVLRERVLRLAGLATLSISIGRLVVADLKGLPMDARILTFVSLGVLLLALSFAYTRLRPSMSEGASDRNGV